MPFVSLGRLGVFCVLAFALLPAGRGAAGEGDGDAPAGVAAEQAAVNRLVAELRPVVAEIRGLEWKRDVPAEVLSRDALQALYEQKLAEEFTAEEMARDTRITRRLGLLGPDEELLDLMLLMMKEMVAGAYDPKTKKLYLVEGYVGEAQKPTLVHELIHALDDQHYDLRALEEPYREQDPDRHFAIRCLFEGSAEHGRRIFQDREPAAALAYLEQSASDTESKAGRDRVMKAVPTHMLLSTLMHYRAGPNFLTRAVGGDFAGGMQRLLADPPTSQEHILHPHKWLGSHRDYPRRVVWGPHLASAAGPRWSTLDEHSVGELDFAVYLDYFLGDRKGRLNVNTMAQGKFVTAMANRAARGWDAGRVRYLERDDGHITILGAYAFDTERDAAEAAEILGAALRRAQGDAWLGLGWKTDTEDSTSRRSFDFAGLHGYGSIRQRGREVLLLDGAPADLFVSILPALEETAFRADPRDQGDDPPDPFVNCAVVDLYRGLGLRLPGGSWRAEDLDDNRYTFAIARDGHMTVRFLVLDQEVTQAGLRRVGMWAMGEAYDETSLRPARVMGQDALAHPVPGTQGWRRRAYFASDAARTYVVTVSGPEEEWARSSDTIQALLDGEPGGEATSWVGLRSVPGY